MSVTDLMVKLRRFTVPDLPRRRSHENPKLKRERSSSLGPLDEVPAGAMEKHMCAGEMSLKHHLDQQGLYQLDGTRQIDMDCNDIQHSHRLGQGHNFNTPQPVDGRQHHPGSKGSVALTVSSYELVTLLGRKAEGASVESLDSWCRQWRQDNHSLSALSSSRPSDRRRCTIALPLPWEQGGQISSSSSSSSSSPTGSSPSFIKSGFRGNTRWSSFRVRSLFSLTCLRERVREMLEKDAQEGQGKKNKCCQRILRPPTRYCYRRGISGLPIQCAPDSMHLL